jgi:hypothetical protein
VADSAAAAVKAVGLVAVEDWEAAADLETVVAAMVADLAVEAMADVG